jgi:hypothetical protein
VQPLLTALELEGSPYLNEPCNSDFPTNPQCNYPQFPAVSLVPTPIPVPDPMPSSTCTCGSPWVMHAAQAGMAGFRSANGVVGGHSHPPTAGRNVFAGAENDVPAVIGTDSFHDVSDVHPFHLPHIWNECATPIAGCILNVTTVTMQMCVHVKALDTRGTDNRRQGPGLLPAASYTCLPSVHMRAGCVAARWICASVWAVRNLWSFVLTSRVAARSRWMLGSFGCPSFRHL